VQLQTFQYIGKSWSVENFPDLDSENTLVLVFAAPEYIHNPSPIRTLSKHYPQSKIIGCSSAGEISGEYIVDHSLSVAVIKFEQTKIKISARPIESSEKSYQTGKDLAGDFLHDKALRALFVLSDGLNINGTSLVEGINSINKKGVIITGGLAGDGSQFKQTWTIFNDKLLTNHVVAVGFYGEHIKIGHGSQGGWDIFGLERRITRSKDNILYELDNIPALKLYKEYLGDKASGLPATGLLFPLAIRKDLDDEKHLVRTILGVDEKNNALIFAGDVPTGYLARLMRGNLDKLINGAFEASKATKVSLSYAQHNSPMLLIAISCVGRRLLLGERSEEECALTLESFPKSTEQVGFYSYGELSPYNSGFCDLHNQTMTLTSISEDN
jgi:hypothetical protein